MTQLHLNRTPSAVWRTDSGEAHEEPAKVVQTGGEGGSDQGGEKCLEAGRTVSLREATRLPDKLEVAGKGEGTLKNGWVTGLGKTRNGSGVKGFAQGSGRA